MKQIVCANCGAKYKLPDTFKSDKAKCKACGSVIDVASQVSGDDPGASTPAAAKPASAKPAGAKPARARPAAARRSKSDDGGIPTKPRRGRAAAAGDEGGDDKPRRRERVRGAGRSAKTEPEGGNKGVLIGGGIAVLALAVVGVFWFLNQDDEPKADDVANKPAVEQPKEKPDANTPTTDPATTDANANPSDAQPSDADGNPSDTGEPAEADAPKPKPKRSSKEPQSRDEVYNPKAELEPVPWPEGMTEKEQAHVTELVATVVDGAGAAAIKAKDELAGLGYKSLAGMANAVRELDYFDSFDVATAFEFTRLMRRMTKEMYQVPFQPVDIGDEVDLVTAHKNAHSARHWNSVANKVNSKEEWDGLMDRAKKRDAKNNK